MALSLRLRSAVVLLVLGWFVLCVPWFVEKRTVPWDSKDEFYPNLYYISQTLRSGELPLWNPYSYSGYPIVSDPQSMLFSPLAVALMTAVDKPSVFWFDAVEFLHILMGGLGMLLLAVRFGRTPLAGLFAAAVYMFGGPAASRLQHVPILLAYGYFPFALLTLDLALKSKRVLWGLCFGLVAGIMAAHQVQVAFLFSLVLIGYVVHEAVSSDSFLRFFADRFRTLLAAFCAGALMLIFPLTATLQFLPLSTRPGFPYEAAIRDSMHPFTLLTLLVHDFFGNAHATTNWAPGDSTQAFLYLGALAVVLFLFYGVATGAVFERPFRYFFGVGMFGLLYALGGFTPFYWLVYHVVPGVRLFQRPPDGAFLFNMAVAMAAGFLIDRLLTGSLPPMRRSLVLAITAASVVSLVWGIQFAAGAGRAARLGKEYSLAIVFMALSLALLRAAAKAGPAKRRVLLLLGLVLLATDLRIHSLGTEFNTYPGDWTPRFVESLRETNPVMRILNEGLNSDDLGPYRVEVALAEAFWRNGPMVSGIQSTQGYNPLGYELYGRVGAQDFFAVPRPFTPLMPSYSSPIFNLLGAKYIVTVSSLRELDPKADESRFKVLINSGLKVWQNLDVLPRVLAATSVYVDADPDRAIRETGMPALDYKSTVVLTHIPETLKGLRVDGEQPTRLAGDGEAAVLKMQTYRNSEVVIRAESSRDVIVVLNDLYYPYWRVYVDDREQELLRANYIFRGVHVGPGQHEIVFRFKPFTTCCARAH